MGKITAPHQTTAIHSTLPDEWQQAYVLWISEFRSRHTREAYNRAWEQFYAFCGLHAGAVERDHVRAWKIVLGQKHKAATVNQKLSAISSFYEFIKINKGYLRDDNPAEDVHHIPVNPYGKATALEDGQDVDLLKAIDRKTLIGQRDYTILLLFLTTAVRLDAIASATVDSFRNQGSVMYFAYVNKGGDEEECRLPTNTTKVLRDYIKTVEREDDAPLFGMKYYQIQYMVKKRCDAVFGPGHGISVHSLRHTAAMNAERSGARITEVSRLMRHKSVRVTSIYLQHVNKGAADALTEKLDERYQ